MSTQFFRKPSYEAIKWLYTNPPESKIGHHPLLPKEGGFKIALTKNKKAPKPWNQFRGFLTK
jgi:hypothetical protein